MELVACDTPRNLHTIHAACRTIRNSTCSNFYKSILGVVVLQVICFNEAHVGSHTDTSPLLDTNALLNELPISVHMFSRILEVFSETRHLHTGDIAFLGFFLASGTFLCHFFFLQICHCTSCMLFF